MKLPPGQGRAPGAGAPEPLEALFERARGAGFTPAESEALWSRVDAALTAPAEIGHPAGPGAAAGPAAGVGVGVKVIVAIVIGGGLAVAGMMARGERERGGAGRAAVVQASRPAAVPAGVRQAAPPGPFVEVDDLPRAPVPAVAAPEIAPATSAAGPERRSSRPAAAAPRVELPQVPSTPDEALAARAAPAPEAPAPAAPSTSASRGGENASSPASADPSPSEGVLLLRARRELASDPAGALALTQDHARLFPAGALVQEREVLAIEALARLGRQAEARRRLDAFRGRFPRSPHVARLDALVGQ